MRLCTVIYSITSSIAINKTQTYFNFPNFRMKNVQALEKKYKKASILIFFSL